MGATVLIVDDNEKNLRLLGFVVRAAGYNVRTAADGRATRASLREEVPSLVLLDLQLPDVDGLDLAREIKADPKTANVPVVAVTAAVMAGSEDRARAAGCDAFVGKPIDTARFAELLVRFLGPPGSA